MTDLDVGTPAKVSGKSLMEEGLAVEIKDKPGAAVITYRAGEIDSPPHQQRSQSMTTSKELVKKAIRFQGPERIPLSNPYDLKTSDIVNVDVVRNFMGPNKTLSEWGFEWQHLENDLTMGQPKEADRSRHGATWTATGRPIPTIRPASTRCKKTRDELGDDKYYKANFVLSGFTVMAFLRGFSETLEDMYLERENIERLADIVFGFEEEVIKLLEAARLRHRRFRRRLGQPEEHVHLAEALARDFQAALQAADRVGPRVRARPLFPLLRLHLRHHARLHRDRPRHPESRPAEHQRHPADGRDFSGKMCFACPVSYQTTGISGSKEDIYGEVKELVDCLGNHNGGLIGLLPTDIVGLGAKPENVDYMLDAFRTSYKPNGK